MVLIYFPCLYNDFGSLVMSLESLQIVTLFSWLYIDFRALVLSLESLKIEMIYSKDNRTVSNLFPWLYNHLGPWYCFWRVFRFRL